MFLLRITFKTLQNNRQLRQQILKLRNQYKFNQTNFSGIISIKQKKKIFTVLRSPNINKKSREQFSFQNYNKRIIIKSLSILQIFNILITIKNTFSQNTLLQIQIKQRKNKRLKKKPINKQKKMFIA